MRVATAFRTIPLQKYVRFLHATAAPAPNDVSWGSLGVPGRCDTPNPLPPSLPLSVVLA